MKIFQDFYPGTSCFATEFAPYVLGLIVMMDDKVVFFTHGDRDDDLARNVFASFLPQNPCPFPESKMDWFRRSPCLAILFTNRELRHLLRLCGKSPLLNPNQEEMDKMGRKGLLSYFYSDCVHRFASSLASPFRIHDGSPFLFWYRGILALRELAQDEIDKDPLRPFEALRGLARDFDQVLARFAPAAKSGETP